jgi:hypothetical protein
MPRTSATVAVARLSEDPRDNLDVPEVSRGGAVQPDA